jgi:hypothetical protein
MIDDAAVKKNAYDASDKSIAYEQVSPQRS